MRSILFPILFPLIFTAISFAQMPTVEPGVSHELAKWRAARYSDVRYKLNLTLEKMSPVLKGTIEIRVKVDAEKGRRGEGEKKSEPGAVATGFPIVLDWRKIKGSESLSTISNVSVNGTTVVLSSNFSWPIATDKPAKAGTQNEYYESNEHLIFRDGVVAGENVIKLDFTSPILTSGSAITRYVDREDGAEYIYSLFVPSDASTAFPVFDQPDLKARFTLTVNVPIDWRAISNTPSQLIDISIKGRLFSTHTIAKDQPPTESKASFGYEFQETKPISTYVFAFAAGPFEELSHAVDTGGNASVNERARSIEGTLVNTRVSARIYVRKSQAEKFKPHAAEVFRLNREGIKFLETYFDYKFPFPKYDIVLIPEFPFGGMEHAGATFLREDRVIFPQEPTKNDYITRSNVIFHEAAHQWFGDTVTMKWFDDLWLKEGFAEFMAYKTLEKVMPEYNAWKVFYERNKQAAYLTDSTKGTTPIYQEIANLNSAKSAYGNIVYRKAPSFLKQAEFYIGADKFQTAVRSFLKKHEFENAGWEDLVKEFEASSKLDLKKWAARWVKQPGLPIYRPARNQVQPNLIVVTVNAEDSLHKGGLWEQKTFGYYVENSPHPKQVPPLSFEVADGQMVPLHYSEVVSHGVLEWTVFFPNYQDYGYGIFLLDDKSRDYVLKNIGREKDDFLRTMMWGSLWDSVREGELDPKDYVELVVKNIKLETDESTIQTLLGRVSTAMRYYIDAPTKAEPLASTSGTITTRKPPFVKPGRVPPNVLPPANAGDSALAAKVENLLIERMQNASTPGERITYYRAFLNMASTDNARRIMKVILKGNAGILPATAQAGKMPAFQPRTKDRFDIVTRLIILGDPEALRLLADLEKTETSDEAKRYAYAARAGIATADNKAKYWNDFVNNKDISESWIEAAFGPFNSVRQSDLTLPFLEKALAELPSLKRNRKIFFVNGWLGAFIGGQKSAEALAIVNKFLADNPNLDNDLGLKILENVDLIERAVKIRSKFGRA